METVTSRRNHTADYYTDYWQMRVLAELIARNMGEEQRAALFNDYKAAADALTDAKAEGWDDLGDDRKSELTSRYNVLLRCCYDAGFTVQDLSPHWVPVG